MVRGSAMGLSTAADGVGLLATVGALGSATLIGAGFALVTLGLVSTRLLAGKALVCALGATSGGMTDVAAVAWPPLPFIIEKIKKKLWVHMILSLLGVC